MRDIDQMPPIPRPYWPAPSTNRNRKYAVYNWAVAKLLYQIEARKPCVVYLQRETITQAGRPYGSGSELGENLLGT